MSYKTIISRLLSGLLIGVLSGCISAPYLVYTPGTQVQLAEKEALLAVRLKFGTNIRYVEIDGQSKGSAVFQLDNTGVGLELRIVRIPAGHYCVFRFGGDGWYLYSTDVKKGICFDVKPGTLNYAGDLVEEYRAIRQQINYKDYLADLQQKHPDLFKQYILAE